MNKKKPTQNAHLKAANLIRRLPVHQRLNESQAALVKLTPAWQQWAKQAISENKITAECYQNTELSGLDDDKLVITCSTAVFASQIKHQQQSILDSLLKEGPAVVKQLNIQLRLPTFQNSKPGQNSNPGENSKSVVDKTFDNGVPANKPKSTPLTSNSLDAIENCRKSVSNEQLASSLKRLAETLKKLNS